MRATVVDPRRLYWDACLNTRDLGGFPTVYGRTTRWGALVRSDNICRLTHHGRLALLRHGVRTVIDLRSDEEVPLETDPFAAGDLAEVSYLHIPQLTREFWARCDPSAPAHEVDMLVVETCRETLAAMVTAIAVAPDGGVLVYCHAGKERTGLAAAFLLAVAGVDGTIVAAEHALSDEYLEPLYRAWAAVRSGADGDPQAGALTAPRDQMARTLGEVEARYGGVDAYLLDSGVRERDLGAVRRRMLA